MANYFLHGSPIVPARTLLLAGHGLAAQDALDRTDPSQQVERERPLADTEQAVRIETQPVLEMPASKGMADTVAVGAIVIDGLVALDRADFASVIEPFADRRMDHA